MKLFSKSILILFFLITIKVYASEPSEKSGLSKQEMQIISDLQQQISILKQEIGKVQSQNVEANNKSQFSTYRQKIADDSFNQLELGGITPQDIASNIASDGQSLGDSTGSQGVFVSNGRIDVGGTPAITTQGQITYLGSYSGNNSIPIGMISSNLFASTILGQRDTFDDYSVFFGGYIEADAQTWFGSQISRAGGAPNFPANGQNIYLTNSKLYFLSNLGHYVTAQFDFDTDETGGFGLGNAFVIFGNLDTSPFFVTAGRNKLSVGSYGGGGPWTSGIIDEFLSPDKVTNVSLNYKNDIINTNITVFGSDDKRANFSAGFFYTDSWTEDLSVGFNAGYVFNIAGAGNGSISQFLDNIGESEKNIGVLNFDGTMAYSMLGGIWQLQGGWSATTNKQDFHQNGSSVNTGAWYLGVAYALTLGGRDTNFNITYGQSYNAENIPMPTSNASPTFGLTSSGIKNQMIASAQRAYFDNNVLFGPEYSYQRLYNGEHMNTLTLDLSVYI
ncbi:DUF3573 domain-containing protein [Francisella philomiragia]|uniref:DUF3573 domain-containing protein n=1 Tax=Francisella philomiragia TaxID=28110 RepID=A0AAW3DCB2_9GAMM|nr:DUF3573 domain-containing protein [Francisella philomiragia]AJI74298.1 hypothetical protein BZ13_1344 [Francisella philomiragia subsp. philomiragia ATCC 25015]EET20464.1 conserved hypothetical protein [Francisella philomiragia subsp. philomiragia ATCC 25015]KFJ42864.1 hypothetical protein DR78_1018 [Francisella philomiragia]MBK2095795.1 DUF3573 domain-containing protein [Francisella philomiragia]MBK2237507.1 DUF3573 domain-containing protein [Francisella philomiragia]